MNRHQSSQGGFTMMELLIAIVILAVGLLGLAELQITAIKSNTKSGSIVAAATVAQMAVEEIMAVKTEGHYLYGTMLTVAQSNQNWPNDPADASLLDGGVVDADGDGDNDYSVTFTSVPNAAGDLVTDITVTVTSLMGGSLSTSTATGRAFKDLRRVYAD